MRGRRKKDILMSSRGKRRFQILVTSGYKYLKLKALGVVKIHDNDLNRRGGSPIGNDYADCFTTTSKNYYIVMRDMSDASWCHGV